MCVVVCSGIGVVVVRCFGGVSNIKNRYHEIKIVVEREWLQTRIVLVFSLLFHFIFSLKIFLKKDDESFCGHLLAA